MLSSCYTIIHYRRYIARIVRSLRMVLNRDETAIKTKRKYFMQYHYEAIAPILIHIKGTENRLPYKNPILGIYLHWCHHITNCQWLCFISMPSSFDVTVCILYVYVKFPLCYCWLLIFHAFFILSPLSLSLSFFRALFLFLNHYCCHDCYQNSVIFSENSFGFRHTDDSQIIPHQKQKGKRLWLPLSSRDVESVPFFRVV